MDLSICSSDQHAVAPLATSPSPPQQPQRHRWFDPWLTAKGQPAISLVATILDTIENHERTTGARRRARKASDAELHRRRVEAVICNLIRAVLRPPPTGRMAIPLGHGEKGRSRYKSAIMGKPLSVLLATMVDLGWVDRNLSMIRGEVTSIAPTDLLAEMISDFGIQLSDLASDEGKELIVVTRNKRGAYGSKGCREIDYTETPATIADREAMRRVNAFLDSSDIAFNDDGLLPRVNPLDRTMKRRYVIYEGQEVRFDQSGRLCGGYWQNIKKRRRRNIRIDGEPVAVLDYSSMFSRLAYAAVGAVPPEGDLYAIPGLEGYRSGVKVVMNALLFDEKLRSRLPKNMGIGVGDDAAAADNPNGRAAQYKGRLPKGWTIRRVMEVILRVHPCLKDAWGRGLGMSLMHLESEILLAVLLELVSRNVPALGLHDGLLVAASQAEIAREVMMRKALEMTGIVLPVTCKLV